MIHNKVLRAVEDVKAEAGVMLVAQIHGTVPIQIIATHAPIAVAEEANKDERVAPNPW